MSQNEEVTPIAADYHEAALLRARARTSGAILQLTDCLIAAVAIRLDLPLVTGNTGDFQAMQRTGAKLTLDNWRA